MLYLLTICSMITHLSISIDRSWHLEHTCQSTPNHATRCYEKWCVPINYSGNLKHHSSTPQHQIRTHSIIYQLSTSFNISSTHLSTRQSAPFKHPMTSIFHHWTLLHSQLSTLASFSTPYYFLPSLIQPYWHMLLGLHLSTLEQLTLHPLLLNHSGNHHKNC